MSYRVKEIFFSIQGEGKNLGRVAIFCRFSGCNLWNGKEATRNNAICKICDTDFADTSGTNGGLYQNASELADVINELWQENCSSTERKFVIFTGGEPALQLDSKLIMEVKKWGFYTSIETNGTIEILDEIDWITVSPKSIELLVQKSGNELKLLYPLGIDPKELEDYNFDNYYLSPITSEDEIITKDNTKKTINYILNNPKWQLTGQFHKHWQIR